jgi:hypothetical protein
VIPKSLDDRLIYLLRSTGRWQGWPLDQIVPSRAIFLDFLHERWPIFVRQKLDGQAGGVREGPEPYDLRYSGPKDLPFDHDDVRVYMDNLFTDGLLVPTGSVPRSLVQGTWMAVGVAGSDTADYISRFRKLLIYWRPIVRRRAAIIKLGCRLQAGGPRWWHYDGRFRETSAPRTWRTSLPLIC